MNITKPQIEELIDEKGNPKKCRKCFGTKKTPARRMDCRDCQGTGQATIEIDKELNICKCGCHSEDNAMRLIDCLHLSCKGKIQKYKVGYAYEIHLVCGTIVEYFPQLGTKCLNCNRWIKRIKEQLLEIKIISETETKQYVQMVQNDTLPKYVEN